MKSLPVKARHCFSASHYPESPLTRWTAFSYPYTCWFCAYIKRFVYSIIRERQYNECVRQPFGWFQNEIEGGRQCIYVTKPTAVCCSVSMDIPTPPIRQEKQLQHERDHCKEVMFKHNNTPPKEATHRQENMKSILGSCGERFFFEPPVHMSCGSMFTLAKLLLQSQSGAGGRRRNLYWR